MERLIFDKTVHSVACYSDYSDEFKCIKYHYDFTCVVGLLSEIKRFVSPFPNDCFLLPLKADFHIDFFVRAFARHLKVPFLYVFGYNRNVQKQSLLAVEHRKINLENAFYVKPNLPSGYKYILFDDVVTTGSTLMAMRDALLKFGVDDNDIFYLTLLQGVNKRNICKGLINV